MEIPSKFKALQAVIQGEIALAAAREALARRDCPDFREVVKEWEVEVAKRWDDLRWDAWAS